MVRSISPTSDLNCARFFSGDKIVGLTHHNLVENSDRFSRRSSALRSRWPEASTRGGRSARVRGLICSNCSARSRSQSAIDASAANVTANKSSGFSRKYFSAISRASAIPPVGHGDARPHSSRELQRSPGLPPARPLRHRPCIPAFGKPPRPAGRPRASLFQLDTALRACLSEAAGIAVEQLLRIVPETSLEGPGIGFATGEGWFGHCRLISGFGCR